jgi:hypothetical protein
VGAQLQAISSRARLLLVCIIPLLDRKGRGLSQVIEWRRADNSHLICLLGSAAGATAKGPTSSKSTGTANTQSVASTGSSGSSSTSSSKSNAMATNAAYLPRMVAIVGGLAAAVA